MSSCAELPPERRQSEFVCTVEASGATDAEDVAKERSDRNRANQGHISRFPNELDEASHEEHGKYIESTRVDAAI